MKSARWPPLPGSPFATIRSRGAPWSEDQLVALRAEGEALELELGDLLRGGAAVDAAEVQRAIAAWARHVGRFCPLTPELFAGLGQHYVAHPAFRARYEAIAPGLAVFLRDAIAVYCRRMGALVPPIVAPAGRPGVGRSLP